MPSGFRLVVEPESSGLNLPSGFRLDTPLARARSYFQRIGTLSDRVHQLRNDRSAANAYVHRFWQERGEALRASRVDLRGMPNEVAVQQLLKETPVNVRESIRDRRYKEWQEVAEQQAFREYFRERETLANAMWQRHREQNPEASDRDSYAVVHNMLATYGFQPPGAGKLPPLVFKDGRLETDYTVGWTELKNIVRGIPRGARRLMVAPKRLGTAAGEYFADISLQDEPGAEVSTSNIYRQTRKSMDLRREQVNKLFKRVGLEGEEVPYLPKDFDLWGTVGEQIPQLAVTATGAMAARLGHKISGNLAMIANMFALEGSEAYDSYLQYAAEKGIDPRLASDEAFLGAIVYAAISSALERAGPFELLQRRSPGAFKRITMAAIGAFTEGGTEFTQALTQEAIAHGLDLRKFDMESLRKATQEALAGAIGGAGMMSIAYQGPIKPRFIEPGFVDLDVDPPQVYQPSRTIDPIDTVLQFPTDQPAVLQMPPAKVIPFPTELQEFMPPAEGEPAVLPMPLTEVEGEAQVLPFRPAPAIPPAEARVYPEGDVPPTLKLQEAITEAPAEVPAEVPPVEPVVSGQMTADEVIDYVGTMEENAEVIRGMIGEGPFVQVDMPVQDLVPKVQTPGDVDADKLAEAERRLEAGEVAPPVVAGQVDGELIVVDGVHRVLAAAGVKQGTMSAIVPVAYAEAKGLMPEAVPAPAVAPAVIPGREVRPPTEPISERAQAAVEKVGVIAPKPAGSEATTPYATYEQASKTADRPNKNVWIRQSTEQENEGCILLIQWNSDLLQTGEPTEADAYYDRLYEQREGFVRADDFWEIPQWVAQAANSLDNTDVYVIRDIDEAIRFLKYAGYGTVAFSVLDVNKALVRQIAEAYNGPIVVGGYIDLGMFKDLGNVTPYDTLDDFVKAQGQTPKPGASYRHFEGTSVVPRIALCEGCLHKCAFCVVPKTLIPHTDEEIQQQTDSFVDLDFRLVYVNDKTFGQGPNFEKLVDVYGQISKQNPNFEGFIIQTTAAQLQKLNVKFLRDAGVRYVEIGVESYNDAILKQMHKPANERLIEQALQKLRAAEIIVIPNVMVGLPGETRETYENTLGFLAANSDVISHVNVYNLAVYEGTELADVIGDVSETDLDENRIAKSFYADPALHETAAKALYAAGNWLLDQPPMIVQPAPVEVMPEQDSLESPESTPMPGDGGTPLTISLVDEARRLLSDDEGFWDPEVMGRAVAGGITTISEEAGTLLTGISALTDETTILRRTGPGTLIVEVIDSAVSQARLRIGKHLTAFHRAWRALPRTSRQWLVTVRDDGQTNHATLIEHPERITEDIPEGVQALIDVEMAMKEDLGNAAVQAKLPQRKGDGSIGPFQKAKTGRYFRIFTPAGQDALRYQKGPMWDALMQWLTDYSERNPDLPADEVSLKEKLRGERKSGETRKQGSLEYTRTFDELPVALKVNGKWQMFQEGRPQNHFRSSLESQARRTAFWAEAQKRLLPLFGKFNKETGQMEAPHPKNPALTDVDGLVDLLRHRAAQAAKRPRAAQRAYDRILENYFREHRGGLMEEITLIMGESRLAETVGVADRNLMASLLSYSGLWDIFQPTAAAHIVGFKRLTRAYARTIADILLHPREYAAEYQTLGAVLDSFNDWSLRSDRVFLDLLGKNAPQAQMFLAENMERMAQTITARAFDYWSDAINGKLRDATARMLKKHLRLTDEEVLQVARGEMTQETKTKIIQNGVKTTNYLAEDPHRRGLLRNIPMLRWLIPFTSVMNGSFRAAGRVITDVVDDVRQVAHRKDAESFKNLMCSSGRLITFATLVFGRGFVQQYLRRMLTGKPLIDPEDPEEWWAIALEAFGEGAMFGPYYRILEAGKYAGGDPERFVVNLVPRIAILLELATAIGGVGKYEGSPWADRLERAGLRFSPTGRTFRNWYDNFVWPERGEYKKLRSLVRVFNKKRGIEARYGIGARNPYYYRIFEAIRDNNEVAAREAIVGYKNWARKQGWDSERARTGLRSSLQSRRPINLKEENAKEFLKSLSPGDQVMAERVQKRYARLVNELTSREVIRRGAPGAPRAPRPATTIGVDWYVTERRPETGR